MMRRLRGFWLVAMMLALAPVAALAQNTGAGIPAATPASNFVINGTMGIDQANEGASVSVSTGTSAYISDQWQLSFTGAATGIAGQQVVDAPAGFTQSLKVTIGTGSATLNNGDSLLILQNLEGASVADFNFGTANAQSYSIDFWVKSNITGTFGYTVRNSATNRSYAQTFTIAQANTWQEVRSAGLTADTTGTWLTGIGQVGLSFTVTLMSGSTGQGTTGSWQGANVLTSNSQTNLAATTSNTFQLTGVQITLGGAIPPFQRLTYAENLLRCQRYYEKTYDSGTVAGTATFNGEISTTLAAAVNNAANLPVSIAYKVTKDKDPTITVYRPRATVSANTIDVAGTSKAVSGAFSIGMEGYGGVTNNSSTTLTDGSIVEFQAVYDARL